jgi:hypothetical protein
VRTILEFICPECECRQFTTRTTPGGQIGRCRGCGHEWDRDQDYVYFVLLRRFKSPREYREYQASLTWVYFAIIMVVASVGWLMSGYTLWRYFGCA